MVHHVLVDDLAGKKTIALGRHEHRDAPRFVDETSA